jgi:guanyl-specific ribonuclease Sa
MLPMQRRLIPLLVVLIAAVTLWQRPSPEVPDTREVPTRKVPDTGTVPAALPAEALPAEALATLNLIRRGGPFPYRQDGREFRNRERLLPAAPRGHYREYTVPTPGAPDRGARRIVTGGDPPTAWYYTDDHYRSFRPVTADGGPLDDGGAS